MQNRWYDNDPTLSMAISLLQNASKTHQELAARYMFKLMESRNLLDKAEQGSKSERVRFIFPTFRRSRFEMHARHLVELLKHLPTETRQELALQLINYVYILDCGMSDFDIPGQENLSEMLQPESGVG
ncbi:MAG TPA: hypothetical protein V6C99_07290 [Oculatellaceae cyanobacterium]|jgi:hypothetical protein